MAKKVDIATGGIAFLVFGLSMLIAIGAGGCDVGQNVDIYPTPTSCDEPDPYYEVRFGDPVLERQIIAALGLADKHPTHQDLCRLHLISFSDCGITSLSGLQFATALLTINLRLNEIEDVGPLSVLPEVQSIKLSYNAITDISSLSNLTTLQELDLDHNLIVDIEALVGMESIGRVNLAYNRIEDIRALLSCPGLADGGFVDLTGNPLNELSLEKYIPELRMREVGVAY